MMLFLTLLAAAKFHFHLPTKFGYALIAAYVTFCCFAVAIT